MNKKALRALFKSAGLNADQIDYAFVLMNMGRTSAQAIEEARGA